VYGEGKKQAIDINKSTLFGFARPRFLKFFVYGLELI
jgi:hypothetical protein